MAQWRCEKCGMILEVADEDYGDYAGPDYPGEVVMVKETKLRHPMNGCQHQDFKARLDPAVS